MTTFMFSRPDCWEQLSGRIIYWHHDKAIDECLMDAGYVLVKGDEGLRGLGVWCLYVRIGGDARLPKYYVMMDDGSGTAVEIWIKNLPDLLSFIRAYGRIWQELLKG